MTLQMCDKVNIKFQITVDRANLSLLYDSCYFRALTEEDLSKFLQNLRAHWPLCLYTAGILIWSCVSVLSKLIFFSPITVEGTYELVGKKWNTGCFLCFYCWWSRTQLKLTTNSTNAIFKISNNDMGCVVLLRGITIILLHICINCIKPRTHKLSTYPIDT